MSADLFTNGDTTADVFAARLARDADVPVDTVRKVLTALYGGDVNMLTPDVTIQHALHVTYNAQRGPGRPAVERIELPVDVDAAGAADNAATFLAAVEHVEYVDVLHRGIVTVVGPWKWIPDGEEEPRVCVDCGTDTAPCNAPPFTECSPEYGCSHAGTWEWYMVLDELWVRIGQPDVLCIGCLEKRLGRPLTAADFSDLPINEPGPRDSVRLAAARTRGGLSGDGSSGSG